MKLLFLYPNAGPDIGDKFHFINGIAYVSSYVKAAGHETALETINEEIGKEKLRSILEKHKPDIVGFSCSTALWGQASRYASLVREVSDVPIIMGGIHPSSAPEDVISHEAVDMVCLGEGEEAVLELLDRMEKGRDYSTVRNLWVKEPGGNIRKNPLRPLIEDLDSLPFPDRKLCDYEDLLEKNVWLATLLIAGRGCPFDCTYCCHNYLRRMYGAGNKTYTRLRSVENVIDELNYLKENFSPPYILIYDDTFTWNRKWVLEFCDRYGKSGAEIPFAINIRVDTVDREIMENLRSAGLDMIIAGLECGNEKLRRDILHKRFTNEKAVEVFKIADELGIKTYTNNMIGIPGETVETIKEGIALNWKLVPDKVQVSIFDPYPGTELYKYCEEKGYMTESRKEWFFGTSSSLDLPTLSAAQLKRWSVIYRFTARMIQARKKLQNFLKGIK